MAESTAPAATETAPSAPKAKQNPPRDAKWGRARIKTEGRNKRKMKLKADKEFAKTFFEAKSKRSTEKKSAFRKKKTKKK
ncbi:MAG: hypothetical protein AABZ55_09140 [Bdellovibrionota bacterium]